MDLSVSTRWTFRRPTVFSEMLLGQPEARCLSWFPTNQTPRHIRFRRNGRHRASVPRRSLSLDDLANAARQHHQLGDRHDGYRAIDDLFESGGVTLPLLLVGLLLAVFLGMEARRYRYFNVWRARASWLEMNFYVPIFTREARDDSWQVIFARDYTRAAPPHFVCPRGWVAFASLVLTS